MKVLVVDVGELGSRIAMVFHAAGCIVDRRSQRTEKSGKYDLILIHNGTQSLCTEEELRAAKVYYYSTAGGRSGEANQFRRSISKFGVTGTEAAEFIEWLNGESDHPPSLLGGRHPDFDWFLAFSIWLAGARARQELGAASPPFSLDELQTKIPGYGLAETARLIGMLRAERVPPEPLVESVLEELRLLVAALDGSDAS